MNKGTVIGSCNNSTCDYRCGSSLAKPYQYSLVNSGHLRILQCNYQCVSRSQFVLGSCCAHW